MDRGLSVAGERDDIEALARHLHGAEFLFKESGDLGPRRQTAFAGSLRVVTGLAVEAVEGACLAVDRREIDAERRAEAPAVDGTEDRIVKQNCLHDFYQLIVMVFVKVLRHTRPAGSLGKTQRVRRE